MLQRIARRTRRRAAGPKKWDVRDAPRFVPPRSEPAGRRKSSMSLFSALLRAAAAAIMATTRAQPGDEMAAKTFGFGQSVGQIVQTAYVVQRIRPAIDWWINDGKAGPFFLLDSF